MIVLGLFLYPCKEGHPGLLHFKEPSHTPALVQSFPKAFPHHNTLSLLVGLAVSAVWLELLRFNPFLQMPSPVHCQEIISSPYCCNIPFILRKLVSSSRFKKNKTESRLLTPNRNKHYFLILHTISVLWNTAVQIIVFILFNLGKFYSFHHYTTSNVAYW
jgi:hypothetical protein